MTSRKQLLKEVFNKLVAKNGSALKRLADNPVDHSKKKDK
jgi:hypothetical protein